jgi:hypothetical protein
MPLFKCDKCGAIENTALGDFWGAEEKRCSECAFGAWHGAFPKKYATKEGYYKDAEGFIYEPDSVDKKKMEWTYNRRFKMVGLA